MSDMTVNVLDQRFDPLSLGDRVRFVGPSGCPSTPVSGTGEVIGSDTYGHLLIKPDAALPRYKRDGSSAGSIFTLHFPCSFDNARKCRVAKTRSGNVYEEATHDCYVEKIVPTPPPPSLVKVVKNYWEQ
jgi:hypothetical protein